MVKGFVKAGLRRIYVRIDGKFVPIGWVKNGEIIPNEQYALFLDSRNYDISYTKQPEVK